MKAKRCQTAATLTWHRGTGSAERGAMITYIDSQKTSAPGWRETLLGKASTCSWSAVLRGSTGGERLPARHRQGLCFSFLWGRCPEQPGAEHLQVPQKTMGRDGKLWQEVLGKLIQGEVGKLRHGVMGKLMQREMGRLRHRGRKRRGN